MPASFDILEILFRGRIRDLERDVRPGSLWTDISQCGPAAKPPYMGLRHDLLLQIILQWSNPLKSNLALLTAVLYSDWKREAGVRPEANELPRSTIAFEHNITIVAYTDTQLTVV